MASCWRWMTWTRRCTRRPAPTSVKRFFWEGGGAHWHQHLEEKREVDERQGGQRGIVCWEWIWPSSHHLRISQQMQQDCSDFFVVTLACEDVKARGPCSMNNAPKITRNFKKISFWYRNRIAAKRTPAMIQPLIYGSWRMTSPDHCSCTWWKEANGQPDEVVGGGWPDQGGEGEWQHQDDEEVFWGGEGGWSGSKLRAWVLKADK